MNSPHDMRIIEACARLAHEASRIYCEVIGDPVSLSWEECSEEMRTSIRQGVYGVLNDGHSPEESHKSWLKFKADHGWTYGPVKDEVAKRHPCMVDYAMLPTHQKAKDALFVGTVRMMSNTLHGLGVLR